MGTRGRKALDKLLVLFDGVGVGKVVDGDRVVDGAVGALNGCLGDDVTGSRGCLDRWRTAPKLLNCGWPLEMIVLG